MILIKNLWQDTGTRTSEIITYVTLHEMCVFQTNATLLIMDQYYCHSDKPHNLKKDNEYTDKRTNLCGKIN